MKKYYFVFQADYSYLFNRIGIGLRNPVDEIGLKMISDAENELYFYQYMVAGILVLCAICLFIVVYFFCKSKQDKFEDQPQQIHPKAALNTLNYSQIESGHSSMVSRYKS